MFLGSENVEFITELFTLDNVFVHYFRTFTLGLYVSKGFRRKNWKIILAFHGNAVHHYQNEKHRHMMTILCDVRFHAKYELSPTLNGKRARN